MGVRVTTRLVNGYRRKQGTNTCKYALKFVVNTLDSQVEDKHFLTKCDKEGEGSSLKKKKRTYFMEAP
jgi:hypothetical protein